MIYLKFSVPYFKDKPSEMILSIIDKFQSKLFHRLDTCKLLKSTV